MPDEKQLVPKLKEWLRQQGVTATVAVSRKGCIEIRLEAQDLMAQTFAVAGAMIIRSAHSGREMCSVLCSLIAAKTSK